MRDILHIPKERDRNVEGLHKEVGRKYRFIMVTDFKEKSIFQILFETQKYEKDISEKICVNSFFPRVFYPGGCEYEPLI